MRGLRIQRLMPQQRKRISFSTKTVERLRLEKRMQVVTKIILSSTVPISHVLLVQKVRRSTYRQSGTILMITTS